MVRPGVWIGTRRVLRLIALGYTAVYGILRMINFAHSEIFMKQRLYRLLALLECKGSGFLQQNICLGWSSLSFTMGSSAFLAMLLERIAYRPRAARRAGPVDHNIGASFSAIHLPWIVRHIRAYPEIDFIRVLFPSLVIFKFKIR